MVEAQVKISVDYYGIQFKLSAMNETSLTPEQVHAIVTELREANFAKVGQSFFDERVNRLQAAGWVLGLEAFRRKLFKGRRGNALRTPRYEWRNIAHFYHVPTMTRVFYWNNDGYSKQHAELTAKQTPAPAGTFTTFSL